MFYLVQPSSDGSDRLQKATVVLEQPTGPLPSEQLVLYGVASGNRLSDSSTGIKCGILRRNMDDWVRHFAEEERQRERAHSRDVAATVQRIENIEFHLRSVIDSLRDRMARDVEVFARDFPERGLAFEQNLLDGGFTVRRGHYPDVRLTVEPNLSAGTITVNYVFASQTGTLAPKPKVLDLGGLTIDTLHLRDESGQHAFRTIGQLSEYLLVPVFTGRYR